MRDVSQADLESTLGGLLDPDMLKLVTTFVGRILSDSVSTASLGNHALQVAGQIR